jgi:hypothetical protein
MTWNWTLPKRRRKLHWKTPIPIPLISPPALSVAATALLGW